jgi:hypothetical protein
MPEARNFAKKTDNSSFAAADAAAMVGSSLHMRLLLCSEGNCCYKAMEAHRLQMRLLVALAVCI